MKIKLNEATNTVNEKLFRYFYRKVRSYHAEKFLFEKRSIQGGIFEGLRLPNFINHPNMTLSHMLGYYEKYLNPMIELIPNYSRFVDIGCGNGYYTNGIGRKYKIPVIGIDLDANQIKMANEIKSINGLNLVQHILEKEEYDINKYLQDHTFYLIDIDGPEALLIDKLHKLENSFFLIELHNSQYSTITNLKSKITSLFKNHNIRFINECTEPWSFTQQEYKNLLTSGIPRNIAFTLLNEMRYQWQEWAIIEPK